MGSGGGPIAVGRRLGERLFTDPASIARAEAGLRRLLPALAGARDHARVGRTDRRLVRPAPVRRRLRTRPLRRRLLRQRRRAELAPRAVARLAGARSRRRVGPAPARAPAAARAPAGAAEGPRRSARPPCRARGRGRGGARRPRLAACPRRRRPPEPAGDAAGAEIGRIVTKMGRTAYGRSAPTGEHSDHAARDVRHEGNGAHRRSGLRPRARCRVSPRLARSLFFSTDASRGRPSNKRANKGDACVHPRNHRSHPGHPPADLAPLTGRAADRPPYASAGPSSSTRISATSTKPRPLRIGRDCAPACVTRAGVPRRLPSSQRARTSAR